MFYLRKLILVAWASTAISLAPTVVAQTFPGAWHKVPVPYPDQISDFSFKDSLVGLCITVNGNIAYTTDGGHRWLPDTSLQWSDSKSLINALECTGILKGCYFEGQVDGCLDIAPLSDSFINPPMGGDNGFGAYSTIAEKMLDTAHGFRVAQQSDLHGVLLDSVVLLVTYDAWRHSTIYGGGLNFSSAFPQAALSCGCIVDSNDVWVDEFNTIFHTSNSGLTWSSILPADTTRYNPFWWHQIYVDSQTHEIWATAFDGPLDFAYSNNYGQTWKLDSGLNLWRLSVPAPNMLWGMIGNWGSGSAYLEPGITSVRANMFSNKIAFSSDNGTSWIVDSTTFARDTLVEMHFLDARHGWIASFNYKSSSSSIWYYEPAASAVTKTEAITPHGIIVYPNPATAMLKVDGSEGLLSVFDPLGRGYEVKQNANTLNISALPPGVYFVSDGRSRAKFVKE